MDQRKRRRWICSVFVRFWGCGKLNEKSEKTRYNRYMVMTRKEIQKRYKERHREKELERHRKYNAEHREEIRRKSNEYYYENKEKCLERGRRWRKNSNRRKEWEKEYRQKNSLKIAARNAVNNAKTRGKITPQPCEICGKTPTQAHHDDYTKPLEVRWLCRNCHKNLHNKITKNP